LPVSVIELPIRSFLSSRFGSALIGRSDEWPLTIILSAVAGKLTAFVLMVLIVLLFGPEAQEGFSGSGGAIRIFGALVLAPLLESLIVWLSVWLLGYCLRFEWHITAVLAGLIHVPLHGWSMGSWSVFPTFALQALILDRWIGKGRAGSGYWIVVGSHALQNLIAVSFRVIWL
jgi:preprotein translocase subunit SecG